MTYRIAIGTSDRINITEHFGKCSRFHILDISQENDSITFVEDRITGHNESCGSHEEAVILDKINALKDCQLVLVKQVGGWSEKQLVHNGIVPLQQEGSISRALIRIKNFYKRHQFIKDV